MFPRNLPENIPGNIPKNIWENLPKNLPENLQTRNVTLDDLSTMLKNKATKREVVVAIDSLADSSF